MIGAILDGLVIGSILAMTWINLRIIGRWRMSTRREYALARALQAFIERDHLYALSGGDEDALRGASTEIAGTLVALHDELHNQERHERDLFLFPPSVGKPWRDFEPAPTLPDGEVFFEGPA